VSMRFAVETWAPDFGAPADGAAGLGESGAPVDAAVERDPGEWAPIRPRGEPAASVLFVDGVQRVDARVWVTGDDGMTRPGACASWAAGAVRCAEREAAVVAAEVRRGVLCPGVAAEAIATRHGVWRPVAVPDPPVGDPVGLALGQARGNLEARVAGAAAAGGPVDLVIVDGPLGGLHHIPGAVGYVKTHHVTYLPPDLQAVATALGPGERTPLFTVGEGRFRWSWYLRLPGPATHPWWGVVRCEAPGDLGPAVAADRADRVTVTLPRFASQPFQNPRAPQNLHPIAGLERQLKRRLGDVRLLERALRQAAVS
jgi:hypothetical protein